jgi:hypothetical protein
MDLRYANIEDSTYSLYLRLVAVYIQDVSKAITYTQWNNILSFPTKHDCSPLTIDTGYTAIWLYRFVHFIAYMYVMYRRAIARLKLIDSVLLIYQNCTLIYVMLLKFSAGFARVQAEMILK